MRTLLFSLLVSVPSWAACAGFWGNGYTYCQPITIASGQVTGTLTDFTATVCFGSSINSNCLTNTKQLATVANGGNLQNASGFDVIFTSDAAGTTPLKYSRVIQNLTTGVAELKLKYTIATGTTAYMFTGNASVSTDQSDTANACDSFTLAKWSFPDGTTLSGVPACGSLSMTNHGLGANAAKLDGGLIGNSSAYMEQTSTSALQLNNTSPLTISFWISQQPSTGYTIVGNLDRGSGTLRGWEVFVPTRFGDVNVIFFLCNTYSSNILEVGTAGLVLTVGVLRKVDITYDGSDSASGVTIYIDGTSVMLDTPAFNSLSATTVNTQATRIAANMDGTEPMGTTVVDEMTIVSGSARSADWVAASYNNESNNAGFWTLGTQVINGTGKIVHRVINQ